MDKEKLYKHANKLKFLSYEIESLAKILNLLLLESDFFITKEDKYELSKVLRQKTVTLAKMCQRHEYNK